MIMMKFKLFLYKYLGKFIAYFKRKYIFMSIISIEQFINEILQRENFTNTTIISKAIEHASFENDTTKYSLELIIGIYNNNEKILTIRLYPKNLKFEYDCNKQDEIKSLKQELIQNDKLLMSLFSRI